MIKFLCHTPNYYSFLTARLQASIWTSMSSWCPHIRMIHFLFYGQSLIKKNYYRIINKHNSWISIVNVKMIKCGRFSISFQVSMINNYYWNAVIINKSYLEFIFAYDTMRWAFQQANRLQVDLLWSINAKFKIQAICLVWQLHVPEK